METLTHYLFLVLFFAKSESLVQLYMEQNFTGLLGEYYMVEEPCTKIVLPWFASSLKMDQCIVIHDQENCQGQYTYKLNPANYPNLFDVQHKAGVVTINFNKKVASFAACKSTQNTIGDSVTFYTADKATDKILDIKNLCGPTIISYEIVKRTKNLDNHGNCIFIYIPFRNITFRLEGGRGPISNDFSHVINLAGGRPVEIRPCNIARACVSLNATVIHFSIMNTEKSAQTKTSDMSMAPTSYFINDGWATLSQDYTASTTFTEATETTVGSSYSSMNSFSVKSTTKFEFGGGIPLIAATKVKTSLSLAYTGEWTSTQDRSSAIRHETSTTFSVNQRIQIEPCTKYKVNSYLKVIKGYPMKYNVTFEVTGSKSGEMMTAEEIREHLGSLEYINDKNVNTVVASELGTILVDYGLRSVVDGDGEILPKCLNDSRKVDPRLYFLNMKPAVLLGKVM